MTSIPEQPTLSVEQEALRYPSEAPQEELPPKQVVAYSAASWGYGTFYALNNFILPLFLAKFTDDKRIIGLMSSTDSIEGIVMQPIIGSLSDRLRSKWGRRIPFLLCGIPLAALFIILTPLAAFLPVSVRLGGIIASIIAFTFFYNLARAPYEALMADITPAPQRGRVMAISTLFSLIGQVFLLFLPIPLTAKFTLSALLMLATTLLTCWKIREPERAAEPTHGNQWREMRLALQGLKTLRQARLALIALFFAGVGIGAVFPFLTLFVIQITKSTEHQAEMAMIALMAAAAATVVPFGKVTDLFGAKRILLVGLGLTVIAALGGLWITEFWQVLVLMTIAGIGNAAQSTARYPLLTELVPAEEVGFYTGLQNTAMSLALPVTAIITGALVNQGGYRVIFAVCAFNVLLAMGVLSWIRLRGAAQEIAQRNHEMGR